MANEKAVKAWNPSFCLPKLPAFSGKYAPTPPPAQFSLSLNRTEIWGLCGNLGL